MRCPNCGQEILTTDKFCIFCGQKNVSAPQPETAWRSPAPIPKQKLTYKEYLEENQRKNAKWYAEHPYVLKIMGITGNIVMLVSLFIPIVTIMAHGFSFWEIGIHEKIVMPFLIIAIISILISTIFCILGKYLLGMIFSCCTAAMFMVVIFMLMQTNVLSMHVGGVIALLGWAFVMGAWSGERLGRKKG